MTELLNQGGFGCVYYPGINCAGKSNKSKKTITKLQREDFSSENELKIGKIITTIKDYENFFSPATGMCRVNLAKISKKIVGKCEVIKNHDTNNVVLMDFPYVKNINFIEILNYKKKNVITQLFNTYSILLDAIDELNRKNIVHFDLKLENILFEETTNIPIIIDFGISLYIPDITFENASNYLYVYSPDYYIWPIEVHVLSFLLNETSITLTEVEIKKISNEYVNNNKALSYFSVDFREKYENMCNETMAKYIGMKREDVFEKLMSTHHTWDTYSLAIIFLNVISSLIELNNVNKPNEILLKFVELILLSISPDVEKRPSIREAREKFNKIFYNNENVENYMNLINIININKTTIKKLQEDMKVLHVVKLDSKTNKSINN